MGKEIKDNLVKSFIEKYSDSNSFNFRQSCKGKKNKSSRICTVAGCQRHNYGLGLCSMHYQRFRKSGKTTYAYDKGAPRGYGAKFIEDNVDSNTMECIIFPYKSRCEYGKVTYKGKRLGAHALMCQLAHGEKPTEKHQALHLPIICKSSLCVNPNHLRWGTIADNKTDLALHTVSLMGLESVKELIRWMEYSNKNLNLDLNLDELKPPHIL